MGWQFATNGYVSQPAVLVCKLKLLASLVIVCHLSWSQVPPKFLQLKALDHPWPSLTMFVEAMVPLGPVAKPWSFPHMLNENRAPPELEELDHHIERHCGKVSHFHSVAKYYQVGSGRPDEWLFLLPHMAMVQEGDEMEVDEGYEPEGGSIAFVRRTKPVVKCYQIFSFPEVHCLFFGLSDYYAQLCPILIPLSGLATSSLGNAGSTALKERGRSFFRALLAKTTRPFESMIWPSSLS